MSARYVMTSNNYYLHFQLDYIFYTELLPIRAQTKLLNLVLLSLMDCYMHLLNIFDCTHRGSVLCFITVGLFDFAVSVMIN